MYHDYDGTKGDPGAAPAQIAKVVRIAKDCIGPVYGKYMVQHSATHVFIHMLMESCENLENVSVPEVSINFNYNYSMNHLRGKVPSFPHDTRLILLS